MGRNTGNRVSNAIYGDKWSTPYRVGVSGSSGTGSSGKRGRKGKGQSGGGDTTIVVDGHALNQMATDLLNRRAIERRNYASALRSIADIPIPADEDDLVNLLNSLSVAFSSVSEDLFSGERSAQKKLASTFRNAIFRKYSQVLSALERRYPRSPFSGGLFRRKWHMFFSRSPWNWIWVVYAVIMIAGLYNCITYSADDLPLVATIWAIPIAAAAIILISRYIRTH